MPGHSWHLQDYADSHKNKRCKNIRQQLQASNALRVRAKRELLPSLSFRA